MERPATTDYHQYPYSTFGVPGQLTAEAHLLQIPETSHETSPGFIRSARQSWRRLKKAGKIAIGVAGLEVLSFVVGGAMGAVAAIKDAELVEHETQSETEVVVPPRILSTEALNESKFIKFSVALAATTTLKDTWSTTLLNQQISWSASTTSTYNWQLKKAKEEGKPLNYKDADLIFIEGSFGPGIEATYDPSAKPWALRRTADEMAEPTIVNVTVGAEDIIFTPVINPDPFSFAAAFTTRHDLLTEFIAMPDEAKASFGGTEQTYKEGKGNLAQSIGYLQSVSTAMDKCGQSVINTSKLKPVSQAAIQKLLAESANRFRGPGEPVLIPEDITVNIEAIEPNFTTAWTKELEETIAEKTKAVKDGGGTLEVVKKIDDAGTCEIAETNVDNLNKEKR